MNDAETTINNAKLIDLTKKGTIIIGTMRSGTNLTVALTKRKLIKMKVPHESNGEYFIDINELGYDEQKYCYFNMIEHMQNVMANNTKYSVGTIVYPKLLDFIGYNPKTLAWYNENFHLVKLIRKNYLLHFMSHCIFSYSDKLPQYGIESINEAGMPIPYKPTISEINWFIDRVLEHTRFPCDNVIAYEGLPHVPIGMVKKNVYKIEPEEFFENYDEVVELLSVLEYNVCQQVTQ